VGGNILISEMNHFRLFSWVCVPAHLTHTHTTCIELNFLEDMWDYIWWIIVMTWGLCKQGSLFKMIPLVALAFFTMICPS